MKLVNARVHHEPDGAPHFVGELTELVIGIGVEPKFITERFTIQRPALDVGRELHMPAEHGQGPLLLRQRDLEVMTGH